jgi:DNA-binding protein HU-beta
MTKAELVDKMAKDAGISKVAATAALNSFTDGVTKALKKKDGKVTLVGFGTFSKVRRKARKGRNPQTGEAIKIKASTAVKFKAGKKLKDAV